jgi:hypothetical protein
MHRLLRVAAPLLVVAVLLSISTVPQAFASCASDSGPAGSPIIFVGSAQEERRGFTRFTVVEVWAGPGLAPEVWVLSGQEQPPWPLNLLAGVGSSGDVEFRIGARSVVGASRDFKTSSCSVQPAGSASKSLRPDQVRSPVPGGVEGADHPPLGPVGIGLSLAAFATVTGAAVVLVRRRRSHR